MSNMLKAMVLVCSPMVLMSFVICLPPTIQTAGTCYMVKMNTNGHEYATCNQEPDTECSHDEADHCEERVLQTYPQKFACWCSAVPFGDTKNSDCRCDGIATDDGNFYHIIECAGACWVCGTGVDKCKPHTVTSGTSGPACECIGVGD